MFKLWVRPTLSVFLTLTFVAGAFQSLAAAEDTEKENPAAEAPSEVKDGGAQKKGKKQAKKEKPERKAITPTDYGRWERLLGHSLSADGQWLTYETIRVDKKQSLTLHNLKSKKRKPVATYEQGSQPVFSEGSGIALIEISPGEENVGHIFLLPVLHLAHCCEVLSLIHI